MDAIEQRRELIAVLSEIKGYGAAIATKAVTAFIKEDPTVTLRLMHTAERAGNEFAYQKAAWFAKRMKKISNE